MVRRVVDILLLLANHHLVLVSQSLSIKLVNPQLTY